MSISLTRLIDRGFAFLDGVSRKFSNITCDLEFKGVQGSTASLIWKGNSFRGIALVSMLLVIGLVAIYSRLSQYETMQLNLSDYFLPGLVNVSTTADSGAYLSLAREILSRGADQLYLLDAQQGQLLSLLVALVSNFTGAPLEVAGRYLVYSSALITSYVTFAFLAIQGQKVLGLAVAISLPFFWPVYSRTSIGMIDTDLLNLTLVLSILSFFALAARCNSMIYSAGLCLIAGAINHIFYLWYGRPGFTLAFVLTLILVLLSARKQGLVTALSLFAFLFTSGLSQVKGSIASLTNFIEIYLGPAQQETNIAGELIANPTALIFSSISEISSLSTRLIKSDFGTEAAFALAVAGATIWLLQDWKRVVLALPLIAFLILYITKGHRFGYYAAPLLLIGIFIGLRVAFRPLNWLWALNRKRIDDSFMVNTPMWHFLVKYRSVIKVSLVPLLIVCLWPLAILPPAGSMSPPILLATEAKYLRDLGERVDKSRNVVVTWWDYGHEIRYQTGIPVIVDGSDPANFKNVYISRALISPNPEYAAAQIRIATYFDSHLLAEHYPKIPMESLARDVQKDIYLVLPRDLQFKMETIFKIALQTLPREAVENYDSYLSTFFILYHHSPQRHGPFERIHSQRDGVKVYRLRSPA